MVDKDPVFSAVDIWDRLVNSLQENLNFATLYIRQHGIAWRG